MSLGNSSIIKKIIFIAMKKAKRIPKKILIEKKVKPIEKLNKSVWKAWNPSRKNIFSIFSAMKFSFFENFIFSLVVSNVHWIWNLEDFPNVGPRQAQDVKKSGTVSHWATFCLVSRTFIFILVCIFMALVFFLCSAFVVATKMRLRSFPQTRVAAASGSAMHGPK